MLISTTCNLEMFELHNDARFQQYCTDNDITVFAFSSQEGVYCNFAKVTRNQALESMSNTDDISKKTVVAILTSHGFSS